jgi:hypothetical protein
LDREDAYGSPRADLVEVENSCETLNAHELVVNLLRHSWGNLGMVGFNRIRCIVVAVPASENSCTTRGALARDVLPWADPYVAQLIKNLQKEIREERRLQSQVRHYRASGAEATAA